MSSIKPYSLYQTLKDNIPSKNITLKDKKYIINNVNTLNIDQKTAFTRLVIEHFRLQDDGIDSDTNNNSIFSEQKSSENIEFNINDIPKDLLWILLKFIKICEN